MSKLVCSNSVVWHAKIASSSHKECGSASCPDTSPPLSDTIGSIVPLATPSPSASPKEWAEPSRRTGRHFPWCEVSCSNKLSTGTWFEFRYIAYVLRSSFSEVMGVKSGFLSSSWSTFTWPTVYAAVLSLLSVSWSVE